MKDQRKTEIKVGITVLAGIIIFLWVFGWAKNITVNANRKELLVEFSSVSGLEIGDPVHINGVRKGYVDNITIKGSKVITLLDLDSDVLLKEDAAFSVMMLDLMGGKKVEVYPGIAANDLDYKKLQQGVFVGDIATAMAMLGTVQNDLVDVIRDVKVSLNLLNQTIGDPKFTNELKIVVSNLTLFTENLNTLLKNNSTEIGKLLKSGNELAANINDLVKTNRDSISQTITAVHDALKTSKELLNKVNAFMEQTDKSQNNLGRLLNDPDLMNDLKMSIQQVKELTKLLIEQLKAEGINVEAHIKLF